MGFRKSYGRTSYKFDATHSYVQKNEEARFSRVVQIWSQRPENKEKVKKKTGGPVFLARSRIPINVDWFLI